MSMTVSRIIDSILAVEGSEYTNNPADSGGPTKYGITLATLTNWRGHDCTAEDVRNLTECEARQIYRHEYVNAPGFDRVLDLSPKIAAEMVDSGVNFGPLRPSEWLQRSLNVLNNRGRYYADIVADGIVGPATEDALRQYMDMRGDDGEDVLYRMLNCLQGEKYITLAESREKDETFIYGWMLQRVFA